MSRIEKKELEQKKRRNYATSMDQRTQNEPNEKNIVRAVEKILADLGYCQSSGKDSRGFGLKAFDKMMLKNGVDDGARTHDKQNHNLLLYQLNYAHRRNFSISVIDYSPLSRQPKLEGN